MYSVYNNAGFIFGQLIIIYIKVRKLLAAAKSQYEKFGIVLDKAKKKIDDAGRSLSEAQDRNRIIQKKLKSVEEIDSSQAERLLEINSDISDDEE